MWKILVIATIPLLGLSATSHADWQYTKWGMSLQEVIEVSNGKATPLSASEAKGRSRSGLQALATATYVAGEFKFETLFLFRNGRLKMVAMDLLNVALKDDLKDALFAKYGQPFQNKEYAEGDNIKWRDLEKNEVITFYYIPMIDHFTVMYEPGAPEGL